MTKLYELGALLVKKQQIDALYVYVSQLNSPNKELWLRLIMRESEKVRGEIARATGALLRGV